MHLSFRLFHLPASQAPTTNATPPATIATAIHVSIALIVPLCPDIPAGAFSRPESHYSESLGCLPFQ